MTQDGDGVTVYVVVVRNVMVWTALHVEGVTKMVITIVPSAGLLASAVAVLTEGKLAATVLGFEVGVLEKLKMVILLVPGMIAALARGSAATAPSSATNPPMELKSVHCPLALNTRPTHWRLLSHALRHASRLPVVIRRLLSEPDGIVMPL